MPTRSIRLANGRADQRLAPSGTGGTGAVVGTRGTAPEVTVRPPRSSRALIGTTTRNLRNVWKTLGGHSHHVVRCASHWRIERVGRCRTVFKTLLL
jgi:hypothetical protein